MNASVKRKVKKKVITIGVVAILFFITWGSFFMPESFMYIKKGTPHEFTTAFLIWGHIGVVLSACASVIVYYFLGEVVAEDYFDLK